MAKKFFPFLIVVLFAFASVKALLYPGLPPTHDGEYHVVRFYEFDKALRSGSIYPRWAADLNNGYGVPLFNYVYPLPNYAASFFHFLGFSFIDSFKLNMFFASLLGAMFIYFWAKIFWNKKGAMVASVFYTFSPYHFLDIYIRGSVGEVWALAFFPAFLWSITVFIKEKKLFFFPLSSLFLSLTIFSHNILALMFFLFGLLYIFFLILQSKEKKHLILYTLCVIILSLGLSSIFWIPALFEKKFVTGLEIFNVEENFPDLFQLLIPSWGSGFSGASLQNQMSFQIGIANLFIIFILIPLIIFKRKINNKRLIQFFLGLFFLTILLMLKNSSPVWQNVPLFNYFQFPWRFLSLVILISSFLAGSIPEIIENRFVPYFLILTVFLLGIGYAKPAYYHSRDDNYYLTRSNFIDGTNSPGNYFNTIWFNKDLEKQKEKIMLGDKEGSINNLTINPTRYNFEVLTKKDTNVVLNTAYFPGWAVFINEKKENTSKTSEGLIQFKVKKGKSIIEVRFLDTLLRQISILVSLLSLMLVAALIVRLKFKK